jgi:hypothetical protein
VRSLSAAAPGVAAKILTAPARSVLIDGMGSNDTTTTIQDKIDQQARFFETQVAAGREHLALMATEGRSFDELNRQVQISAAAHKSWVVWLTVGRIFERSGPQAVNEWLFEQLAQGADDTWSGRGNDLKRAEFDALRESCDLVRRQLERWIDQDLR